MSLALEAEPEGFFRMSGSLLRKQLGVKSGRSWRTQGDARGTGLTGHEVAEQDRGSVDGPQPLLLALIHRSADLFNSEQELGGLQPLSF